MAIVTIDDLMLELGITGTATAEEVAVCYLALKNAEGAVSRYLRYDPVYRSRTEYYPQSNKSMHITEQVWESYSGQAVLRNYGHGWGTELQVQHIPIRSVASLYIDYDGRSGARPGSFAAETLKTQGTDYWPNWDGQDSSGNRICRDGLLRSEGTWPESPGCVKMTYTAGYTATEFSGDDTAVNARPIYEAILTEAARRAKRTLMGRKKTGVGFIEGTITMERLGDYMYSTGGSAQSRDGTFGNTYDILAATREILNDFVNWGWPLNS